MVRKADQTVDEVMRGYANRGVFQRFGVSEGRGAKKQFKFVWLADHPFTMVYDPKTMTMTFKDLLPNIPPRSAMDRELREFLRGRQSPKLPDHRRVDKRKVELKCMNRGGSVSISVRIRGRNYEYGARKAIKLVGEIFMTFLMGPYTEYMIENFNLPEE